MIDTLDVEVTAEDIAAGVPGRVHDCPIALAVLRALGESDPSIQVVVTRSYVRAGNQIAIMPDAGYQFVKDFDEYRSVELIQPFKMTLKFEPAEAAE